MAPRGSLLPQPTGHRPARRRPPAKSLAYWASLALLVFGTYLPALAGFPGGTGDSKWGWAFPLKLLVPCAGGLAVAVLASMLPLPMVRTPRTAHATIRRRVRFHAHAVRALLDTQLRLCLTSQPGG